LEHVKRSCEIQDVVPNMPNFSDFLERSPQTWVKKAQVQKVHKVLLDPFGPSHKRKNYG
jgi:hypothetical protein